MTREVSFAAYLLILGLCASAWASEGADGLTVEQCVSAALEMNADIGGAEARVEQWKARLRVVEASYYPKLSATGFIAPMFTIKFGDINARTSPTRIKALTDWGPYTGLEATLVQPLTALLPPAHYGGQDKVANNVLLYRIELVKTHG